MQDLDSLYRRAMLDRIAALDSARGMLHAAPEGAGTPAAEDARAAVLRIAHSLRGSGSTYGFPAVSAAAAAVEDASGPQLETRLAELLTVLRAVAAGLATRVRILVVEDDPEMELLLGAILGSSDRDLIFARSGAEARRLLSAESFALILLDLVLPDVDGLSVLRELRTMAGHADTPVVVTSGRTTQTVQVECRALGVEAFVAKPFDPAQLVATVAARLSGRMENAVAGRPPAAMDG